MNNDCFPKRLNDPTRQPLREPLSESERLAYDVAIKLVRIHGLLAINNAINLPEWSERASNRFGKPLLSFWSDVQRVAVEFWELKNVENYEIDMFYSRVRARNDSQQMHIEDWIKIHIIENAYDLITDRDLGEVDLIEVLPENNHPANKHARDLLRKIPPDEMYTHSPSYTSEDRFVPWVERIKEDVLYLLQLMDYGLESRHEELGAWQRDRGEYDGDPLFIDLQKKSMNSSVRRVHKQRWNTLLQVSIWITSCISRHLCRVRLSCLIPCCGK